MTIVTEIIKTGHGAWGIGHWAWGIGYSPLGLTQNISQTLISPCPLRLCGTLREATSCLRYSITHA
ncbi:hypothetical protein [Nostoc sp.]|uniref:hypothetical protein n=1 Tax=Nostoc sp. TaxID=1180 RepID=UPI002FF4BE4A